MHALYDDHHLAPASKFERYLTLLDSYSIPTLLKTVLAECLDIKRLEGFEYIGQVLLRLLPVMNSIHQVANDNQNMAVMAVSSSISQAALLTNCFDSAGKLIQFRLLMLL